jgi:ubiquinone/menaquinone biosynthesis C-methylase UbiE
MSTCNDCSIAKCDIFDFMAKHVGMTVIHPGGMEATRQLLAQLRITQDTKVIDIACGKGTTALYIAERYGCNVVGIDIEKDLIEEANQLLRKKGMERKVSFQVGDAMHLPFDDNSFDVAVSQAMLVLVEDKYRTIQEARRVIKQGGRAGWLELSWKKETNPEFMDVVSNVLCAYCMTNVSTYEGWETIFRKAGINNLVVQKGGEVRGSFMQRLSDEGLLNTMKIIYNILRSKEIRKRSQMMDKYFRKYSDYFGLGTYVFEK